MTGQELRPSVIREMLRQRGIKMTTASRISGIPLRTLTRKLGGKSSITVADIFRLSLVLECRPSAVWHLLAA